MYVHIKEYRPNPEHILWSLEDYLKSIEKRSYLSKTTDIMLLFNINVKGSNRYRKILDSENVTETSHNMIKFASNDHTIVLY
jgi:hypothetical protein